MERGRSNFFETLESAAVDKAPWRKFAPDELGGNNLADFLEKNREDIALCVDWYVLNEPEVEKARDKLHENILEYSGVGDIEKFLIEEVKKSIHRYVSSFGLDSHG